MTIVRQNTVTPPEIALRRELEIRFSRVLAEVLRQPRSDAVPKVRVGSACAVAVLNALQSICPLKLMEDILGDFFEEAFATWARHLTKGDALPILEPKLEEPQFLEPEILESEILEPEILEEDSRPFASLLHSENTKETAESEINQILLELSRAIDAEDKKT